MVLLQPKACLAYLITGTAGPLLNPLLQPSAVIGFIGKQRVCSWARPSVWWQRMEGLSSSHLAPGLPCSERGERGKELHLGVTYVKLVMVKKQSPKRTSNSFSPEPQPVTFLFISNHHKWLEVSEDPSQSKR